MLQNKIGTQVFALVDCNNFFCSCERVFNPELEKVPLVVLSNNDGCIIARSNEAKKLGIPMGAPYFQWRQVCEKNQVAIFSSNFELYGNMSQRIMALLMEECEEMEIYSIDEAFLLLNGFNRENLIAFAKHIQHKIKSCTGIPISIGIGSTKTLAKAANQIAKITPNFQGICLLLDKNFQEQALAQFPVENIWGIGRNLARTLKQKFYIHTAKALRDGDAHQLRRQFNVTMEKIIYELRGISCLSLEHMQPRKQIISSRSFGKRVTQIQEIEEAVSHYTAIACSKLRKQNSIASGLSAFLHTNYFQKHEKAYSQSINFTFPAATDDTSQMIDAARKCIRKIYKSGFTYHKAGVILYGLMPKMLAQSDLFEPVNLKKNVLMQTVDMIQQRYGKNAASFAAEGLVRPWQIKSGHRSARYTTRWNELLKIT